MQHRTGTGRDTVGHNEILSRSHPRFIPKFFSCPRPSPIKIEESSSHSGQEGTGLDPAFGGDFIIPILWRGS